MWKFIDRLTDLLAGRYEEPATLPPPPNEFRTEYREDELLLTKEELEIGDFLAEAYNKYMELPRQHPNDQSEFVAAVHRLQHLVLYRPGYRQLRNQELMNILDSEPPKPNKK